MYELTVEGREALRWETLRTLTAILRRVGTIQQAWGTDIEDSPIDPVPL